MDVDPPGVAKYLLRWATTFEFARSVTSYRDLQDGRILWKILNESDPEYFEGDLPEPNASAADNWIQRWQNRKSQLLTHVRTELHGRREANLRLIVKHIEKLVTTFIRDEREKLPEMSRRMSPDLKAVAIDASNDDSVQVRANFRQVSRAVSNATEQLLKLVFLAAIYSPHSNQRMVQKLTGLGASASQEVAQWIQSLEVQDQRYSDAASQQGPGSDAGGVLSPSRNDPSPEPDNVPRDRDLMWEEQLISAKSTINSQRDKIEHLSHLLEQRRAESASLEEELNDIRARVEKGSLLDASNEVVDQLRKKAAEDRDYIEDLESQYNSLRERTEEMESKIARYKSESDQKTKLRDELQMAKVERDDYMQKAKAAENLRKKIQTLQESDKTNTSLRASLEAAQEDLQGMQRLKDKCAALQKANEENMKTIANGEQEIFDIKTTRRRMDHDLKYYQQRYEAAKERHQKDADTIAEQEEKIRELEAGRGTTSVDLGNLDDEFTSSDTTHAELRARVAELENHNRQLKQQRSAVAPPDDVPAADAESSSKQVLAHLQQRYQSIEQQYLQTLQENLGLDATIKGVEQSMTEARPFIELRDRLYETRTKLDESDKRRVETERLLAEKGVALEAADGRLAAIGKDQTVAIEKLQQSTNAQNELLQKENERLANRVEALQIHLDEKTSLLRHALMQQGHLLRDDEELRRANEVRLVQEQITQHKTHNEPSEEDLVLSLAQRVEAGRTEVKETEDKAAQVSSEHHHPSSAGPLAQHKRNKWSLRDLVPRGIVNTGVPTASPSAPSRQARVSFAPTTSSKRFQVVHTSEVVSHPAVDPPKQTKLQAFAARFRPFGVNNMSSKDNNGQAKHNGLRPLLISDPSNFQAVGGLPNARPPPSTAQTRPRRPEAKSWWIHYDSPTKADTAPSPFVASRTKPPSAWRGDVSTNMQNQSHCPPFIQPPITGPPTRHIAVESSSSYEKPAAQALGLSIPYDTNALHESLSTATHDGGTATAHRQPLDGNHTLFASNSAFREDSPTIPTFQHDETLAALGCFPSPQLTHSPSIFSRIDSVINAYYASSPA